MIPRQLLLAVGTLALWLLFNALGLLWSWQSGEGVQPLWQRWLDQGNLLFSAVAGGLCWISTAATLMWSDVAMRKSPEQQLAAVLGGTGLRMGFVIVFATALYYRHPDEFGYDVFWFWIIAFYLGTLTLEMILVVRRQAALDRVSPPKNPGKAI